MNCRLLIQAKFIFAGLILLSASLAYGGGCKDGETKVTNPGIARRILQTFGLPPACTKAEPEWANEKHHYDNCYINPLGDCEEAKEKFITKCTNSGGEWRGGTCVKDSKFEDDLPPTDGGEGSDGNSDAQKEESCTNSGGTWEENGTCAVDPSSDSHTEEGRSSSITAAPTEEVAEEKEESCTNSGGTWEENGTCAVDPSSDSHTEEGRSSSITAAPTEEVAEEKEESCTNSGGSWSNNGCTCEEGEPSQDGKCPEVVKRDDPQNDEEAQAFNREALRECEEKVDRADLCCVRGGVAACVGDSPYLAMVDTYTHVGVNLAGALSASPHEQDEHKALQKSENFAHAQAGLLDTRAAACTAAITFCQNSCGTSNLFGSESLNTSGIEARMLSLANHCAGLSSQAASLATQATNLHLVAQGYRKQRKALKGGEEIVEKGFCKKYPDSAICKSLEDTDNKDVVSVEEDLSGEGEDTIGASSGGGSDIENILAKIRPPQDFGDLDKRPKALGGPSGNGTSRAVGSVSSGGGGSGAAKKASPPPTSYEPPAFAPKSSKEVGKFLKGSGSGGPPGFYGNSDREVAGFGNGLFAKKKRKKKKSFKEKSLMIGQILNRGQRDLAFKEENIFKLINRTYHAVCTAQMLDCPLEEE